AASPKPDGNGGVRFFTMEWWCEVQSGKTARDPHTEYRSHFESIRNRLAVTLQTFVDGVSLHDGELRELVLSPPACALVLLIDADDGLGGRREFRLCYGRVSLLRNTAASNLGFRGRTGFGDWGYDEVDVTDDGDFEHRILFASGIEITIQFATFEWNWTA